MNTEKVLLNAKTLRANQTEAEQRLWHHLRAHRFMDSNSSGKNPWDVISWILSAWNGC
jgi:very-short-patch-repair endonuclease